jgi:hypothetical protein
MKKKKKKVLIIIAILGVAGLLIAGGIGLYMFNKPHRDVQSADVDFTLSVSEIVSEYLTSKDAANKKYLASNGDSKILEITGVVSKISEDFSGQKVVLLKGEQVKAGVSATFTTETSSSLVDVQVDQTITIKGVIRSGASYDEDLEMYEHVVIEKSDIVLK